MSKAPWHIRRIRIAIYCAMILAVTGIAVFSAIDAPDAVQGWIAARQLFGLWALALLLVSMLPGPINFVTPWFPFRAHLVMGRRAFGISCFVMASCHVVCYLGPMSYRGTWRNLYLPGRLWICGLLIGLATFVCLGVLAGTSRRRSIRSLGPRRWKTLHRSVYVLLPAALLHATFLGADFGVNKGPDVRADVDAGCLVGMLLLSLLWLTLFLLRGSRVRWAPPVLQRRFR